MHLGQYAVIGHPVGHTMSPFIHSRLFALSGSGASYGVADISPDSLPHELPALKGLDGFNVTIPHKQAIIPLLDGLDEKASLFHSVNTVKNVKGRLTGHTTDGAGFVTALKTAGIPLAGRVLILGAGGVSRVMACEAAAACDCPKIDIAVREHSLPAARRLCADLEQALRARGKTGFQVSCAAFSEMPEKGWDLLANGTPCGMYPNHGDCPAEERLIKSCGAVFDAIYNPRETRLLQLAAQNGARTLGGMSMLVWQAAAAQTIWTGATFRPEDIDALCEQAEAEMKRKFGGV